MEDDIEYVEREVDFRCPICANKIVITYYSPKRDYNEPTPLKEMITVGKMRDNEAIKHMKLHGVVFPPEKGENERKDNEKTN